MFDFSVVSGLRASECCLARSRGLGLACYSGFAPCAQICNLVVDALAKLLELAGAAIILGGVVLASVRFALDGSATNWSDAYQRYRAGLGRGILLGLELLVGADIISTITAPLTFASVGLLGAIIAIRTFLSFSLETEIEGCWPWQRAGRETRSDARRQD